MKFIFSSRDYSHNYHITRTINDTDVKLQPLQGDINKHILCCIWLLHLLVLLVNYDHRMDDIFKIVYKYLNHYDVIHCLHIHIQLHSILGNQHKHQMSNSELHLSQ